MHERSRGQVVCYRVYWAKTHNLEGRRETFRLTQPVAPSFPRWIRPVVETWDGWQEWLIAHSVCMRHQEHKVFGISQRDFLPARVSWISARGPWVSL